MIADQVFIRILVPSDVSTKTKVDSPDLATLYGLPLAVVRQCTPLLHSITTSAGVETPANGEVLSLVESAGTIKVRVTEGSTDFASLASGHINVVLALNLIPLTGTAS